jgi:hypothetical protein
MAKNKPKNTQEKEELVDEVTSEETVTEDATPQVVPAEEPKQEDQVQEEPKGPNPEGSNIVEQPAQEQLKIPTPEEVKKEEELKDKYAASKNIDLDASYDLVKATLRRTDIDDTKKLEIISNGTNIAYKAVIEEFEDYNREVQSGLTENPQAFANKVFELYGRLRRILEDEDVYVTTAKLMILLLLFRKYFQTSFVPSVYSLYADLFPGSEQDYVEYQYIMASLYTLATQPDPAIIKRRINFNKPDFKYGKKLEELFINLFN